MSYGPFVNRIEYGVEANGVYIGSWGNIDAEVTQIDSSHGQCWIRVDSSFVRDGITYHFTGWRLNGSVPDGLSNSGGTFQQSDVYEFAPGWDSMQAVAIFEGEGPKDGKIIVNPSVSPAEAGTIQVSPLVATGRAGQMAAFMGRADAYPGWEFDHWECTTWNLEYSSFYYYDEIPDGVKTENVVAVFKRKGPFNVSFSINLVYAQFVKQGSWWHWDTMNWLPGGGTISPDPSTVHFQGYYGESFSATFVATPDQLRRFYSKTESQSYSAVSISGYGCTYTFDRNTGTITISGTFKEEDGEITGTVRFEDIPPPSGTIRLVVHADPSDGGKAGFGSTYDPVKEETGYIGQEISFIFLRADENSGYDFEKWSDGDTNRSHPTIRYVVEKSYEQKDITAHFKPEEKAKLILVVTTVDGSGGGTVEISPHNEGFNNTYTYKGKLNDVVTAVIKATPADGYEFVSWSDGKAQEHTITETLDTPNRRVTFEASFKPIEVPTKTANIKIEVVISPDGGGTATATPETYTGPVGLFTFELEAKPNPGWRFVRWDDGGARKHTRQIYAPPASGWYPTLLRYYAYFTQLGTGLILHDNASGFIMYDAPSGFIMWDGNNEQQT